MVLKHGGAPARVSDSVSLGGAQELAFLTSARDAAGLGDTLSKNYYCGKIHKIKFT